MITIKNYKTGESYKSEGTACLTVLKFDDGSRYYRAVEINRMQAAMVAELNQDHYEIAKRYDTLNGNIVIEQPATAKTTWQEQPATQKQYDYLLLLGCVIKNKNLTKLTASKLIDSIKRGEGTGWLGIELMNGSM
jgi:hypothetical protein